MVVNNEHDSDNTEEGDGDGDNDDYDKGTLETKTEYVENCERINDKNCIKSYGVGQIVINDRSIGDGDGDKDDGDD